MRGGVVCQPLGHAEIRGDGTADGSTSVERHHPQGRTSLGTSVDPPALCVGHSNPGSSPFHIATSAHGTIRPAVSITTRPSNYLHDFSVEYSTLPLWVIWQLGLYHPHPRVYAGILDSACPSCQRWRFGPFLCNLSARVVQRYYDIGQPLFHFPHKLKILYSTMPHFI